MAVKEEDVEVSVETIGPDEANSYLAQNVRNRAFKFKAIDKYAADMKAGLWDLNGAPIRFDWNGHLLDGQNRLQAVVDSGVSIKTIVVRGLDPASQETMDTGVPRGLSDVLRLRGESNYSDLASGLVRLWQYRHNPQDSALNAGPSIHEALALLEREPGIRQSISVGDRANKATGLRRSVGTAAHYVLSEIDAEDATAFFDRLTTGVGLDQDDPILRLRELLLEARQSSRVRIARRTRAHDWALLVKAWNAYRDGRKVKLLAWRPGGANPESFPVPV